MKERFETFTVLINKHKAKTSEEFLFLEKCSNLKEDILEWFTLTDGNATVYSVQKGWFVATVGGVESSIVYIDGVLTIGEDNINLDGINSILFFSNDQFIKCTIYATVGNKQKQTSFAFSPRCGYVVSNQSQQGGSNA